MHRLYENEDISVFWDSDKCRHAKRCVTGCPQAFDITKKPWINIDNAPTDKVWKAVTACPSGALTIVYNHEVQILFEEASQRSIAVCKGRQVGECDFEKRAEGWNIYHTEVAPDFQGKEIARRLVYRVIQEAERNKAAVIPTCSYAAKMIGS